MTYKTLQGIHELGADSSPDEIRAQRADGWDMPGKFVNEATHGARLSQEFSPDAVRVNRWWRWNGFISDSIDSWIGTDNPVNSARRWVLHMKPQLNILASTGRVWYVETFNEQGLSEKHCRFDAAVGMELKAKYGDQIRIAAFSMSSGSFNEQFNWDLMLEHTIKPLTKAGVKFALSFHCYSSWLPPVGNLPGLQHADLAPRFPNIRWSELQMDDVPPFDIEYNGPRYDWTGFAVESMIRYFHKHSYGRTPLIVTESHIDNMGPIGGHSGGGHYEWDERGYYDFLKTELGVDVETLLGRSLWYAERRYRAINAGGGNILAVFPFTYGDQDRFSRWYRHYRHRGGIFNEFKYQARTAAGQDKPDVDKPAFPDDGRFYARTFKSDNVNVRPEPHTGAPAITQMSPFEVYVITHQIHNGDDIWLRIDYGFHTYAWAAYRWRGASITEISHPIDDVPLWGGSWDANDETWMNGEKPMGKLTPVMYDPSGAIIQAVRQKFTTPFLMAEGTPGIIGDTIAPLQHNTIMQWEFTWNAGKGDEPPDCGNPDTFMEKMRGQTTDTMVEAWFGVSEVDQYVNAIRKQLHKKDPATGEPGQIPNPDYNPYAFIQLLKGDSVPPDQIPAFLGFSARATSELFGSRIISNLPTQYGLHAAVINMEVHNLPDLRQFWQQAEGRDLLETCANSGAVIVLNRRIVGRFQDMAKSDVFPVESFDILSEMGWLSQLRFFLKFEYADGWQSQGHSEDDVLADMWLLEKTAQEYAHVVGCGLMLRRNPEQVNDAQWKKDSDITPLEDRFAAILSNPASAPAVDWQPEGEPEPDPPVAIIKAPTTAVVGQEVAFLSESKNATSIEWRFGAMTSTANPFFRSYNEPGTYTATLQAFNGEGIAQRFDTASHTITVTAQPEPQPKPEPQDIDKLKLSTVYVLLAGAAVLGAFAGAALVLIVQAA